MKRHSSEYEAGRPVIRVLLAERLTMIRGALAALLANESDMTVVAQLGTGAGVLPAARRSRPDIAVLDLGLPVHDGLASATALREALPACRNIVLAARSANAISIARTMMGPISAFLSKDAPAGHLAETIRRVHRGERVIDPELVRAAFRREPNPLTQRERDVLTCVAEGAAVTEVAVRLSLVPGTVRNYMSAIMSKVGARNRVDAVRIARDHGWLAEQSVA
jgi:two-component system, NarL family, response regulator DesR